MTLLIEQYTKETRILDECHFSETLYRIVCEYNCHFFTFNHVIIDNLSYDNLQGIVNNLNSFLNEILPKEKLLSPSLPKKCSHVYSTAKISLDGTLTFTCSLCGEPRDEQT